MNSARSVVVGDDTADLGGGMKYDLRAIGGEPPGDRSLIEQIQFAPRRNQDLDILAGKTADDGAAHHSAVAGDKHTLALQFKR
jgi:hypothetical protein